MKIILTAVTAIQITGCLSNDRVLTICSTYLRPLCTRIHIATF